MRAAREAGLPKVRLVEEPQAAFYHWLERQGDDAAAALTGVNLAIVIDVGGGTTDLTLIKVELRESGPRLTRIAVGEHLMLGGDNMDLAIAKRVETRVVQEGSQLGVARFSQLIQQCRAAKEQLLAENAPDVARITVLGSGSKLVGGARSADVSRTEVEEIVLDGFLPRVDKGDTPMRRRGGIIEFGLPYAADAAVTRHVSAFLASHDELAREALGDKAGDGIPVPDAVLFNGGVFRGRAIADRMRAVLGAWRG